MQAIIYSIIDNIVKYDFICIYTFVHSVFFNVHLILMCLVINLMSVLVLLSASIKFTHLLIYPFLCPLISIPILFIHFNIDLPTCSWPKFHDYHDFTQGLGH